MLGSSFARNPTYSEKTVKRPRRTAVFDRRSRTRLESQRNGPAGDKLKVAQHFSAGKSVKEKARPGGTIEMFTPLSWLRPRETDF
jgi:hypothetical protein